MSLPDLSSVAYNVSQINPSFMYPKMVSLDTEKRQYGKKDSDVVYTV